MRAVAVYEWTGDEGKATASRVVPVSLFINGQLQDAAVYLARPVPFAIDTGTIYETQKAGVDEGTLELVYERHLTSGDTAMIDDGWLAYGAFKAKPKETLVTKKSGPLPKVEVSGGAIGRTLGGRVRRRADLEIVERRARRRMRVRRIRIGRRCIGLREVLRGIVRQVLLRRRMREERRRRRGRARLRRIRMRMMQRSGLR